MLKLEVGKFYYNRRGEIIGPIFKNAISMSKYHFLSINKETFMCDSYTEKGFFDYYTTDKDLVSEYIPQPEKNKMKLAQELRKELDEYKNGNVAEFITKVTNYIKEHNIRLDGGVNLTALASSLDIQDILIDNESAIVKILEDHGFTILCSCEIDDTDIVLEW